LELQEVLPNHCQLIMVAERKGVDRLGSKEPARTRRPPPVLPQQKRGTRGFHDIQNKFHISCWICGLSKPTGNVGQHAHDNAKLKAGQFHF